MFDTDRPTATIEALERNAHAALTIYDDVRAAMDTHNIDTADRAPVLLLLAQSFGCIRPNYTVAPDHQGEVLQ